MKLLGHVEQTKLNIIYLKYYEKIVEIQHSSSFILEMSAFIHAKPWIFRVRVGYLSQGKQPTSDDTLRELTRPLVEQSPCGI